ncbi:MAG: hypothetical protein ACE5JU_23445, partial [Candidatus Binatia bacterium]
ESSKMKEVLLDEIRKLSDDTIRKLTNLQEREDIDILRTAILRRADKWIERGVLEADAPWEDAWNLFRSCLEMHRAAEMSQGDNQNKGKFPLGRIVATPGALRALQEAEQDPLEFLLRHQAGDWGELCEQDKRENDFSLKNGYRLLSAYSTRTNTKIWIITEKDRSATTLLLPGEY